MTDDSTRARSPGTRPLAGSPGAQRPDALPPDGRPLEALPLEALIDDCVHCGFCLPACPTYALWGQEMDSPRGRIHLLALATAREVPIDDTFRRHFDACLGCMACETACPSGVHYEPLLEAARAGIEDSHLRDPVDRAFRRALLAVFPRRPLLRGAALVGWVYRALRIDRLLDATGLHGRLPARARALVDLMPEVALRDVVARTEQRWPARGQARLRVGVMPGCVQSVFFRAANQATARVLAAEGCDVIVPRAPSCCGALSLHAGHDEHARAYARAMIARFEAAGVDRIAINAAGCGATVKRYDRLLSGDPGWRDRARRFTARVRDISELLDELEPRATRHPLHITVAYHDACHLGHAQGIRAAPRRLLRAIPGLTLVELPEPDLCCGSAGIYNLTQPDAASQLGARKAAHIRSVGAAYVAAANPGCLLQIRRHLADPSTPGSAPALVHPIELIDASIRGARLSP